jgi:hypothetical protein
VLQEVFYVGGTEDLLFEAFFHGLTENFRAVTLQDIVKPIYVVVGLVCPRALATVKSRSEKTAPNLCIGSSEDGFQRVNCKAERSDAESEGTSKTLFPRSNAA